jgi:predicted peptidase
MKNLLWLTVSWLFLPASGFAQDQGPSVAKLSDSLAQKAKSLNPEYLLFSPGGRFKGNIPLVIYLHGAGGVGDDIQKLRGQAGQVWRGIGKYKKGPCFVVAPQAGKRARQDGGWVPKDLNILLVHLKATLKVDEERIYLTGNSMGGYGSWIWGGHNPEHFAAIAPVSGGIGPGGPKDVTPHLDKWATNLAKVPVMAFAGSKDRVVPAERSQRMIAAIEKAGGKKAKIRIYPDEGHGAGRIAFGSAEFYEWMFALKRD